MQKEVHFRLHSAPAMQINSKNASGLRRWGGAAAVKAGAGSKRTQKESPAASGLQSCPFQIFVNSSRKADRAPAERFWAVGMENARLRIYTGDCGRNFRVRASDLRDCCQGRVCLCRGLGCSRGAFRLASARFALDSVAAVILTLNGHACWTRRRCSC